MNKWFCETFLPSIFDRCKDRGKEKNGCGYISFGMDNAEQELYRAEAEAERQRTEAERIERTKKNPERLAKRIAYCNMKIDTLRKAWEEDKEEPDFDESDAEWCAEEIAKYEAKLAAYTA